MKEPFDMDSFLTTKSTDTLQPLKAEFDLLADEYYEQHKVNIRMTGETPEFFAEYKVADLAEFVRKRDLASGQILDFGCGIGNSIPFFRKHFGQSSLNYCDISPRSIDIAKSRFPGNENYMVIENCIPLPTHSQDIAFSACVFHHIPHQEHRHWLTELQRVLPSGRASCRL